MKTEGDYLNVANVDVETKHESERLNGTKLEISAELEFEGHEPEEPMLCYLSNESCIKTLISLRMKKDKGFKHEIYSIKLSKSSGIRERDAEKIDGALKSMKISGNTTVVNEVSQESRRYFEYEIEF